MIADDPDRNDLVQRAAFNAIDDQVFIRMRMLQYIRDVDIKITLLLKVVSKICIAFIQQVRIDRSFFIDRNQPLQISLADPPSTRFHANGRATMDIERVIHSTLAGSNVSAPAWTVASSLFFF